MADSPKHVAIIMDGNGRWAESRGWPRIEGHRRGAESVRRSLAAANAAGVQYLTLYCFSHENWKRPPSELSFLMGLLKQYLRSETSRLQAEGVRLRVIGRLGQLEEEIQELIAESVAATAGNDKLTLTLAINYGSRQEITDAAQAIARRIEAGDLTAEQIDEHVFAQHLYTADMPDPDLLLRTSGEMRLSNFLLWQLSYAELVILDVAWPDFREEDFAAAVKQFAGRRRRFGGLDERHHQLVGGR